MSPRFVPLGPAIPPSYLLNLSLPVFSHPIENRLLVFLFSILFRELHPLSVLFPCSPFCPCLSDLSPLREELPRRRLECTDKLQLTPPEFFPMNPLSDLLPVFGSHGTLFIKLSCFVPRRSTLVCPIGAGVLLPLQNFSLGGAGGYCLLLRFRCPQRVGRFLRSSERVGLLYARGRLL